MKNRLNEATSRFWLAGDNRLTLNHRESPAQSLEVAAPKLSKHFHWMAYYSGEDLEAEAYRRGWLLVKQDEVRSTVWGEKFDAADDLIKEQVKAGAKDVVFRNSKGTKLGTFHMDSDGKVVSGSPKKQKQNRVLTPKGKATGELAPAEKPKNDNKGLSSEAAALQNNLKKLVKNPDFGSMDQGTVVKLFAHKPVKELYDTLNDAGKLDLRKVLHAFCEWASVEFKQQIDISMYQLDANNDEARKERQNESTQRILESRLFELTMRDLIRDTERNGSYARGGLRRVSGRWVIDTSVRNRRFNSVFVVTGSPKLDRDEHGMLIYRFNVKSRPDRSTTGRRHKGYIRFLPSELITNRRDREKAGITFKRKINQMDCDVHVACSCSDFKYRLHYALWKKGASHEPQGGDEAIKRPPNKTNPAQDSFLCKHLAAMAPFLTTTKTDMTQLFAKNRSMRRKVGDLPPKPRKQSGMTVVRRARAEVDGLI